MENTVGHNTSFLYPVAVITPVFNTTAVIWETFDALRKQSFTQFEWLLVNDGSDHADTIGILNDIKSIDKRIRIIEHTSNKGLPASRNTGIDNSTSPYLFFLDADDLIDPFFLEKAWMFLHLNKEYAFANSYVVGFGAMEYRWKGGFHEKRSFLKDNRNTSCFMARREVFNTLRFDESLREGCEDWDFWLQAAAKGFWGYTIPEFLFYYRRSAVNKWATLEGEKALNDIKIELNKRYAPTLTKNGFPNPGMTVYGFGDSVPPLVNETFELPVNKKHLLCIFPWLEIGGADLFNLNLLKGLQLKGWQLTIVTTKAAEHKLLHEFEQITKDIFHLPHLGTESSFYVQLYHLICNRRISCLFLSNSLYGYFALPWLKQQFPTLPVADYVHCEDKGWYNGGYPLFSAVFTGLLDKTFVTSKHLQNWCSEKGADARKIAVCYINIDTERFIKNISTRKIIRQQLQLGDNDLLIAYVARLTEQKQPLVLAETLSKLGKKGLPFHCVIIGDGPDREQLLRRIRQKKLSRQITYLGSQPHDKVNEYLDASDIFFLPSLYEGIALSIYEAMAKELAIVGANTGGQQELVTPDCGFLIENENPTTEAIRYANHLEQLINNPALAKSMGLNGRKRIESGFRLDQMVTAMDAALGALKPSPPERSDLVSTYQVTLNRLIYLESQNEQLSLQTSSKIFRLLYRFKVPVQKAGKKFRKMFNSRQ